MGFTFSGIILRSKSAVGYLVQCTWYPIRIPGYGIFTYKTITKTKRLFLHVCRQEMRGAFDLYVHISSLECALFDLK